MADLLKVISTEITLTTANNVDLASLVRVVNLDSANVAVITIRDSANNITGEFTLGHQATDYGKEYVVKQPTDTVEVKAGYVGDGIKAVSVAYY